MMVMMMMRVLIDINDDHVSSSDCLNFSSTHKLPPTGFWLVAKSEAQQASVVLIIMYFS